MRFLCFGLAALGPSLTTLGWLLNAGHFSTILPPLVVLHAIAFAAAALLLVPRFEASLLARGLLWSLLSWGTLASVLGGGGPGEGAGIWAVCIGATLIALSFQRTDGLRGAQRFESAPVRAPLTAILALSIADTSALTFWSFVIPRHDDGVSWPLLGAAMVMGVVVLGLIQLRAWAFVLNVVANVAIAALAWQLPSLPDTFAVALTVTAAGQLLAGIPITVAIARGRDQVWPPWLSRGLTIACVTVMAGATWAAASS